MKLMSRRRLVSKRSRHGIEVATWSALVGQKRRRDMGGSLGGRDMDFGVATWKSHCGQERGRDMKSMPRHGLGSRRSRPGNDFATWLRLDKKGRSRHGVGVATWLSRLGGRDLEVALRPDLGC